MDSLYVILKSLQDNSQSTQYLSLVIALLAVSFGPILSYFSARLTIKHQLSTFKEQLSTQISIAERGIKSQVLSKNRQDWINTLRDSISEFVSILYMVSKAKLSEHEEKLKAERLFNLRLRISLLLNATEDDHKQLEDFLEEGMDYYVRRPTKKTPQRPFKEIRLDIVDISQKILKREWERVKKIE
jgi:hypothetical protein